ncbi:MAG: hypothetical protein Q4D78_06785 [Neisseria zoodegmatis]|uniref:hypothetical protein n=1 Tax=Neisseria zoodegmatis TaxID=326523 RepID=UPI0026EEAABE|nr:hypothetical protein [Neisseria zoodegmatis]MDO5069891.1 hypothetical protein [Neisseria zoodegmatis]
MTISTQDIFQQFSDKGLKILQNHASFIKNKDSTENKDNIVLSKIESCQSILEVMKKHNDFEKICPFNTKKYIVQISHDFLDTWKRYPNSTSYLDSLFIVCIAFSREYLLFEQRNSNPPHLKINFYWEEFKADIEQRKYPLEEEYLNKYAQYLRNNEMDLDILNFHLGQRDYQVFLKYEKTAKDAEDKIRELQEQLNDEEKRFNEEILKREKKVDNLSDNLKKLETDFNFVGLSDGFKRLLNKKNTAKWWTFVGLVTLLLAALIPLCFSFYKFIQEDNLSWQKMLPVIGLEFVLIYFFRVVLTHYHSIQTQIIQLELRQSLCQFIESYVTYTKEVKQSLKAEDKDPLEKFENLIFSSILSNPDKVPGTFDGIDGLTSLLKEIKGSK